MPSNNKKALEAIEPNKKNENESIEQTNNDVPKKPLSLKAASKKRENDILKEKLKIQIEKEKVNIKLASLEAKLKLSKVKQKEISLNVKRDVATLKAEAVAQRSADKEAVKQKKSNIDMKKKSIVSLKREMDKKLELQVSKNAIKSKQIEKSIKVSKQKIRDEKRKTANDLRIKKEVEREKAKKLRIELKAEHAALKQKLQKEKLEHKREIINKKLELAVEMDQHRKGIQQRLLEQKSKKYQEISNAKRETALLLQEQSRIKNEATKSKIKSRLRLKEMSHLTDIDIEKEREKHNEIIFDTDVKVNQIKEQGKLIQKFEAEKILHNQSDAKIHSSPEIKFTGEGDITGAHENIEQRSTQEIKVAKTKNDIVTFIKSWRNFDKKGQKLMKLIADDVTSRELKKASRSEYFKTSIENYNALKDENHFVDLKSIIRNSYILAEEIIDEEIVKAVYETIVKAVLNKLRVKLGNYFIVPTKVEGNRTFVVIQTMLHGETVFDLSPLISVEVINGMTTLIDYKLRQGDAIKIFDGFALENLGGDIQVAVNANILRIG